MSLDGSSTETVSFPGLLCSSADPTSVTLTITYTVSGNQWSQASFDIFTTWSYHGTAFTGTDAETIQVPLYMGGGNRVITREITLDNAQRLGEGTTTILVEPFNLRTRTTDSPGLQLVLD